MSIMVRRKCTFCRDMRAMFLHHLYSLPNFFRFVTCFFLFIIKVFPSCSFLRYVISAILFTALLFSFQFVYLSIYPLLLFYFFLCFLFSFSLSSLTFCLNFTLFPDNVYSLGVCFPCLGVNGIPGLIVVWNDTSGALDTLLTKGLSGRAVNVQPVEFRCHCYERGR